MIHGSAGGSNDRKRGARLCNWWNDVSLMLVLMWVKVIAKKKWQRNIRSIMPINGPSIICVGETALILDGSLKGNSKLREVRHPAPEERREIYCSIEWKPCSSPLSRWQWIRNCSLRAETPYTYTVLLFGTEIERYCSSIRSTSKRKYWAQADTNNLLLNAVNCSWKAPSPSSEKFYLVNF